MTKQPSHTQQRLWSKQSSIHFMLFSKRKREIVVLGYVGCRLVMDLLDVSGWWRFTSLHVGITSNNLPTSIPSLLIPETPDVRCQSVLDAIDGVESLEKSPFANCPITSQLRLYFHPAGWRVESLDINGQRKQMGGDEYYITYTDNYASFHTPKDEFGRTAVTAVAHVIDAHDGTYLLEFSSTPLHPHPGKMSQGLLKVQLLHTCGVGRLQRPRKDHWKFGGYINQEYIVENVTAPSHYKVFQPPQRTVDLNDYDMVFALGDSLMAQFIGHDRHGHKNLQHGKNPNVALNTGTLSNWTDHFVAVHGQKLKRLSSRDRAAALVGSSTWDVMRNNKGDTLQWDDHNEAARQLVSWLRNEFNLTVIWKSATAIHLGNAKYQEKPNGPDRRRYVSELRSRDIYNAQKQLMQELGVPFLDVYEATYLSADQSKTPLDARHYNDELNRLMHHWFFSEKVSPAE